MRIKLDDDAAAADTFAPITEQEREEGEEE